MAVRNQYGIQQVEKHSQKYISKTRWLNLLHVCLRKLMFGHKFSYGIKFKLYVNASFMNIKPVILITIKK